MNYNPFNSAIVDQIQALHDKNRKLLDLLLLLHPIGTTTTCTSTCTSTQNSHDKTDTGDHSAIQTTATTTTTTTTARPKTPYVINTQIVAKDRIEISKQVLNSIHNSTTMNITAKTKTTATRFEKMDCMDKLFKDAEQEVLKSIQFGTSLQELIDQADCEIESIQEKMKKL